MQMRIDKRRSRYDKLSSALAQLDNEQLHLLLDDKKETQGWGKTDTITVEKTKIFVKRVPVTDLEYANQFSTKNHYELPTYYQYGIWSAGFGVYRELVAHIKTTNWVLAGASENFPLMYHYRLVPWPRHQPDFTPAEYEAYITYWNSNTNIGQYIQARDHATHQLLIFMEQIPYSLEQWLETYPDQLGQMLQQMQRTLAFLRQHHIIHFDCDFGNIVTDGTTVYLTDFGLLLDKAYDLSEEEHAFLERHRAYDSGHLLAATGWHIEMLYRKLPAAQKARVEQQCAITQGMEFGERACQLVKNIERLHADADIELADQFVATVITYRTPILWMLNFLVELRKSPQKDVRLQHTTLRQLLQNVSLP